MKRKIPLYVEEMVSGAVSRLNNLKNENTMSFAFTTDIHNCIDYAERAMYAISEINKEHPIAFSCMGGDYLCNNSSTPKAEALRQQRQMRASADELANDVPTMILKGNHDDNPFGKTENIISGDELYDVLLSYNGKFTGDAENPKAAYGYYDMPEQKLRAIYLDPIDKPYKTAADGTVTDDGENELSFGNRQINWFAHEALRLPSADWSVIVLSHIMPIATPLMSDRPFGGEAMWEILCAYKNGGKYSACAEKNGARYSVECDFSGRTGDVIAVITGHQHCDRMQMANGIRVITAAAAASDNFGTEMCDNGRIQYKTRGSGEESAFSVFVIDRKERKIWQIRCGAGDDYCVKY